MNTLRLTDKQLGALHMAMIYASEVVTGRLLGAKPGELRYSVLMNQAQDFDQLMSLVLKGLDTLNAETI